MSGAYSYQAKELNHAYNNYYNNTTDNTHNIDVQDSELELDPQYNDATNGDFSIGTNLKAKGPSEFPAGTSTGYIDIGAVQREEGSGSGSSEHAYVFVG